MDAFSGLPWLTQVPPPQVAFLFPFFRHAPSVKIMIFGPIRVRPKGGRHSARVVDRRFGFVKTLKISARLSLQVSDGLKTISLLFIFACRLLALREGVNDILSMGFWGPHGFHFGERFCSLARAA